MARRGGNEDVVCECQGPASFDDVARAVRGRGAGIERPVVCVQGLGFVGSAMATAVADAREASGEPCFNVAGVELPTLEGLAKIEAINAGVSPILANDEKLAATLAAAHVRGNLVATTDQRAYALASVVLVDVPLDVADADGRPTVRLDGFREAMRTLGRHMPGGSLIIIETTVPPGTTEKVAAPELAAELRERGLPGDALLLAYSYERIMPGRDYLDSIVHVSRTYAGQTPAAADACEAFLSKVIDVEDHPLSCLPTPTACETAKVLENSYRATLIGFMEEWSRFAEAVGVDLFDVIETVRLRPTHSNMRYPGFGVGGYCLTKDPLLASVAARELFDRSDLQFPFSTLAVLVNRMMPLATLDKVTSILGDDLRGVTLLLMGVSYRQDVADTRHSPSETFVREARVRGATVLCHDPLVRYWNELRSSVLSELPPAEGVDVVVFAVAHPEYRQLDLGRWLGDAQPCVVDAADVLSAAQRGLLRRRGCPVQSIGRGVSA
jgi:UDP-N-acetyl-D-glucosamine dehydrogenase